jgi:hypothetical protein
MELVEDLLEVARTCEDVRRRPLASSRSAAGVDGSTWSKPRASAVDRTLGVICDST